MTNLVPDSSTFDGVLQHVHDRSSRLAVIRVADTAWIANNWLRERGIPYTATDVLTMTRMMMREERALLKNGGEP